MTQILADENLNGKLVAALRNDGHEVTWIREAYRGIPDIEVIRLAKENNQILITEDKDFGEWVFAHGITHITIIFLRYSKEEFDLTLENVRFVLGNFIPEITQSTYEFITVTRNKIRRRKI